MRLFPVCEEDEDGSDEEGDQSFLVTSPLSDSSFAIGAFPTSPTIASSFAASGAAAREEEEEEPAGEDGPLRPLDPPASPGSGPSDDEMLTLSDAEDDLLGFAPLMRHSSRHTSVPVRPRPRTRCMSMSSVAASSGEPLLSVPVGALHAGFPTLARASLLPVPGVPYMMHESSASTADLLRAAVDADTEKMEFGVLEPQTKVELFDVYSGDEEDEEDDRCTDGKENEDAFVLGVDVAGRAELSAFCAAHQQPTSADGIRVLAAHL
ncbi:uncharacterized protein PHACADRAFT_255133 [Phanerochaete carnosa HHB-10118-sp]|uniref:Uncharacterized protein n=1 Tax=Phanerochaete carnosa (strain HHB-10118-sp) TaxID=650164 RepID=K5WEC0_PHACS|nr:uncharacterized protein PHACADRAFT_255133 [Phanerochaete carnosa HHB-10118-sp]EKM57404.1 hypothetical protein PHACADRAFT_255133 [Phanerochaete carnosa HHB-10118-sp]